MVILTTGGMADFQESVEEIVKASSLPISLIFIGIGEGDFSSFKMIDADITPLFAEKSKQFMKRDCAQFIKFNDYKDS